MAFKKLLDTAKQVQHNRSQCTVILADMGIMVEIMIKLEKCQDPDDTDHTERAMGQLNQVVEKAQLLFEGLSEKGQARQAVSAERRAEMIAEINNEIHSVKVTLALCCPGCCPGCKQLRQRHYIPFSTGAPPRQSDVAAMALGADPPAKCMMVVYSTDLKCERAPKIRLVTKAGNAASRCTYFACGPHAGGNTTWWMDAYERQPLP